ncbi:putative ferredoxin [Lyophyllum shimeji]|uniref:Ferredoxin n=1 Tax=Lyophyllum shimeji TaxID=47721 RepID=A0A9P3UM46_LYOSH|nr:putative ferredoxin [Lyophyllum shimeji]
MFSEAYPLLAPNLLALLLTRKSGWIIMLKVSTQTCRRVTQLHTSHRYVPTRLRTYTTQNRQLPCFYERMTCSRRQNTSMHRSEAWFSRSRWRGLHSSAVAHHRQIERPEPGTGIKVHFKDAKDNLIKTVEANEGDDLLSVAHEYDIDLEGACEGSVACSTCHVILTPEYYDRLPEPEDDENDMLDMAFGLTDTSRLGCQVVLTRELDGMTATLPSATRNMFVDGKKSTH